MLAVPRTDLLHSGSARGRQRAVSQTVDPLFLQLRQLRKSIATEENLPPYAVFNDATLQEMALQRPSSEQALLAISGIGQRKLARFGQRFLHLIATQSPG